MLSWSVKDVATWSLFFLVDPSLVPDGKRALLKSLTVQAFPGAAWKKSNMMEPPDTLTRSFDGCDIIVRAPHMWTKGYLRLISQSMLEHAQRSSIPTTFQISHTSSNRTRLSQDTRNIEAFANVARMQSKFTFRTSTSQYRNSEARILAVDERTTPIFVDSGSLYTWVVDVTPGWVTDHSKIKSEAISKEIGSYTVDEVFWEDA
ncbi:hypothetical protein EDD18DRAFT_1108308 [Armillaria luteobubalina]|uniref:Uncharacterized protein n=1 Tax=Armillaria luteobubalina TaxID=153913 RepID=A0AA39PYW9_9AGAR|nr:hypothetical protein EDD18DRAFT_1108308 [Armillaria luteobubalina]